MRAQQHLPSLLLCALAVLMACSAAQATAAAADPTSNAANAIAAALPKLTHPLGSGQNKPQALGLQPARGKMFQRLMRQFVAASRAGNLELAQQLQQRLFQLTRPKGHRRSLLQPASATSCPALVSTEYITKANWTAAGGNPTSGSGSPSATPPQGPLPSIRYFTFEPCAEWGCRTSYTLVRQADGTVRCSGPKNAPPPPPGKAAPVPAVVIPDFAYFKVYDYDLFWNNDDDNVLAGGAFSNKLTNINQLTSSRGQIGASTSLQNTGNLRIEPNPALGIRADTDVLGTINTGAAVSRAVGDNAVIGIKTAFPSVTASGSFGAVLPGTVVTDRDGGNTDDNVVFRSNQPALFGYFGKK